MNYSRCAQLAVVLICLGFVACQNPNEKVESEKQEAAQSIGNAEQKVEEVKEDAAAKIEDADGAGVDDAKVEATIDIGEAKHELGDEKVEATEEIVEAEQETKTE